MCFSADVPVGDDQRRGGDSRWNCQQGAHHLWEHAGSLRVPPQVGPNTVSATQSPTNYHLFSSADLYLAMLKCSLLKCCICYIQHLPEGAGEV